MIRPIWAKCYEFRIKRVLQKHIFIQILLLLTPLVLLPHLKQMVNHVTIRSTTKLTCSSTLFLISSGALPLIMLATVLQVTSNRTWLIKTIWFQLISSNFNPTLWYRPDGWLFSRWQCWHWEEGQPPRPENPRAMSLRLSDMCTSSDRVKASIPWY